MVRQGLCPRKNCLPFARSGRSCPSLPRRSRLYLLLSLSSRGDSSRGDPPLPRAANLPSRASRVGPPLAFSAPSARAKTRSSCRFRSTPPISAPGPRVGRGRRDSLLALCPLPSAPCPSPLLWHAMRHAPPLAGLRGALAPRLQVGAEGVPSRLPQGPSRGCPQVPPLPLVSGPEPGEVLREAWARPRGAAARV